MALLVLPSLGCCRDCEEICAIGSGIESCLGCSNSSTTSGNVATTTVTLKNTSGTPVVVYVPSNSTTGVAIEPQASGTYTSPVGSTDVKVTDALTPKSSPKGPNVLVGPTTITLQGPATTITLSKNSKTGKFTITTTYP